MLNKIPIIVVMLGVIIHFLGVTQILMMASFRADAIMFIIDLLVALGLFWRKKWGWYLAIILFTQQSIMQPYWSYQKYLSHFFIIHPLEYMIAPALVVISLVLLVKDKDIYLKSIT